LTVARGAAAKLLPMPDVDIVIPVLDEERVLGSTVRRLHDFLTAELPYSWRIVIADSASTDATPRIAQRLARELPNVATVRLDRRGRGRALRAAWSQSDARVCCYMDADLSTDLRALLPLLAPLLSGHSDVAIGTRLTRAAHVVRGPKRELISRAYNRILRMLLRARFSDAQCGFKAARRDALARLLPEVRDEEWFFDTELLVVAQRAGMRIHEVPVDWVDDPDSRVDIASTALADLRGVARLVAATQVAPFVLIGVLSTVAYAALFVGLRPELGAGGANALALALTAVANTQANRRLTFRLRGRERLLRQHAMGAVVYALTLALTGSALAVLHGLDPRPARALELAVLLAAGVCATVTRFLALRAWVFLAVPAPQPAASIPKQGVTT
jgi:putative flippase GtrA